MKKKSSLFLVLFYLIVWSVQSSASSLLEGVGIAIGYGGSSKATNIDFTILSPTYTEYSSAKNILSRTYISFRNSKYSNLNEFGIIGNLTNRVLNFGFQTSTPYNYFETYARIGGNYVIPDSQLSNISGYDSKNWGYVFTYGIQAIIGGSSRGPYSLIFIEAEKVWAHSLAKTNTQEFELYNTLTGIFGLKLSY